MLKAKQIRLDHVEVLDTFEHPNGFVTVESAVSRAGVMPYLDENGDIRYELKHPDDLFSEETMEALKGIPVTDEHPWQMVDTKNYMDFAKGMTHLDVRREGDLLVVSETIFDDKLAAYVLSGKKAEISLGMYTKIVEESGEYDGQRYDVRQTNIIPNHIAHTKMGRAGEDVRARLDSNDIVLIQADANHQKNNKEESTMKIELNEEEYSVEEVQEKFDSLVEEKDNLSTEVTSLTEGNVELEEKLATRTDALSKAEDKLKELKTRLDSGEGDTVAKLVEDLSERKDTIKELKAEIQELENEDGESEELTAKQERIDTLESELETKQAKLDSKTAELSNLESKLDELEEKVTRNDVNDVVNQRLQLIDEARKYAGNEIRTDMSDIDMKAKVIQRLDEDFNLEDHQDEEGNVKQDYIEARYDSTKKALDKFGSTLRLNKNKVTTKRDSKIQDLKDQRKSLRS